MSRPTKTKGKVKDKNRKKTKGQTFKLTNVEDAFYRLTVEDCEKKIDRLRKHLENLDTSNAEIKERIRSLGEDQIDKSADLTRQLNTHDDTIYKYKEEIFELQREYKDVKSRGDATIIDLEEKYKAMHDELMSEIKLLKAKLHMLDDFRKDQTKLNFVIENEEELLKAKKQEYKDDIAQMERKIQIEKELMQKEIETKLLLVSEEFTRSSAMRNATYAQRLIRENIALEKEIDVLNLTQKMMDEQLKEHISRSREVKDTFPELRRKKRELILVAQQKTNLIEKITSKFEKLKSAYTESLQYKNRYQDLMQYQLCKHHRQHQMLTQAKRLSSRAHMLKAECMFLQYKYNENEKEIARLRQIIILIRKTILDAVMIHEQPSNQIENIQRKSFEESLTSNKSSEEMEYEFESYEEMSSIRENGTLLKTLLEILRHLNVNKTTSTISLETVTPNDFLVKRRDLIKSSDSLREPFKQDDQKTIYGVSPTSDDIQISKQASVVLIPKERPERCIMFDVEKGTSLYISSSESNPETFIEEQDHDEFKESSSSYSSFSNENLESRQSTLPSRNAIIMNQSDEFIQKGVSTMPPGTIVDVELDESEEEISYNNDNDEKSPTEVGEDEDEMSVYMFY